MSDRNLPSIRPADLKEEAAEYVPSPTMEGDKWFELSVEDKKLGMKFNGVEITTIVQGSWASKNGIEVDDEIHEVNGKPFGPMARNEKLQALQGERPITIRFKRPVIKDSYFEIELNETKLGMGFKGARISNLSEGGWAQRNGILIDDTIAEVNGQGFSSLADSDKIALFKLPRPITIKFKRPAKTIKAQINDGKDTILPGKADKYNDKGERVTEWKPAAEEGQPADTPRSPSVKQLASSLDEKAIREPSDIVLSSREKYEQEQKAMEQPRSLDEAAGFCACCTTTVDTTNDLEVGQRRFR